VDGLSRDAASLVATLARDEMPVLVGVALRITRDVGAAEECAQDALLRALQQWEESGIPESPAAWLVVTCRNRALDLLRHRRLAESKLAELAAESLSRPAPVAEGPLRDDLLRLVVACCHESLSPAQQAALALRLVCGLTTAEIARLFLVPEATLAQRLVRARRTLEEARAGWVEPTEECLQRRLPAVLDVAYLLLTEGHAPAEGDACVRRDVLLQAMRLSGLVASLVPADSEALAVAALCCLQAARSQARQSADGSLVLLADQDRSLWDEALIGRGLELLQRASALGEPGPRQVEAALAACHAVASSWEETDWPRILRLYDRLLALRPSPVAELNRAVALSFATGPAEALAWLDARDLAALSSLHLLPATRADFLRRLGRLDEAAGEYGRALAACSHEAEREFLRRRLAECRAG
jgi:RNA polymerase sigma factor (sigma-70 family)